MAADDDVIHLADMAAPPWRASANEQVATDPAGFEACEQFVKAFVSRGTGSIFQQTYTASRRWGKILRAKFTTESGGSSMLLTCWIGADGHASVVVKVDDGEP